MLEDKEILDAFYYELEEWKYKGDRHYKDTTEERLIEIYYDNIIYNLLVCFNVQEEEENEFIERLNNLI